ncbi:hypothetical protein VHEMI02969 [[Torrubiella] hemipterigena]|uniref:DUF1996 domain-containing protein n=1 Tax=[Torrubiella] hemipterigena TaxID=1531966 RepID=A0A0A1T9Q5_9HYPO|nr:hypothetical protein VHEMI02969 [[Torrubiella] hemipterigena]
MLISSTASYFDATLVNAGPLTSTFTPPPSCTRPSDHGINIIYGNRTRGWSVECEETPITRVSLCKPSESKWLSEPLHTASTDLGTVRYYSPGLACPSGWVTSGVAVVGKDSQVSTSGRAFATDKPWTYPDYQPLPFASYFVDNMEPSETVVFCCPSGYDTNYFGGCHSTAGDPKKFSYTTACAAFRTILHDGANVTELHGRTYSPPLQMPATLGKTVTIQTFDLPPTSVSHFPGVTPTAVVVDYVEAIVLIHKDSDGKAKDSSAPAVKPSLWRVAAAIPMAMAVGTLLYMV